MRPGGGYTTTLAPAQFECHLCTDVFCQMSTSPVVATDVAMLRPPEYHRFISRSAIGSATKVAAALARSVQVD